MGSGGKTILITGSTGYIGGRLVPKLLASGYNVKVFVRDAGRLVGRDWIDKVEVIEGDVLDPHTLPLAMDGVQYAYYLIHSMGSGTNFHDLDVEAARNFGGAAKEAGLQGIIYLGGLGDPASDLSQHLASRQETGEMLRESNVPVIEFRASVVVGAGSLSFEIVRNLVERLPIMVCPSWVYTKTQPIAIDDLLDYLIAPMNLGTIPDCVVEVGGSDVVNYRDIMLGYAKARGLRRFLLPIPILTPRLSSYWVHLVTPISSRIARPLIEGLRNEVIVRDFSARGLFPDIKPMSYMDAVERTLLDLEAGNIETSWSDALWNIERDVTTLSVGMQSGFIVERRTRTISATPESVYAVFARIGGNLGWYHATWLWRLRGFIDRFIGGVGLRRGRRHPTQLRVGDALDFWRVEDVESNRMIRLRAEMKVPGKAWLQFTAIPQVNGTTLLEQVAIFVPKGLFGLLYWYALYPLHKWVFSGLISQIAKKSDLESDIHFPVS